MLKSRFGARPSPCGLRLRETLRYQPSSIRDVVPRQHDVVQSDGEHGSLEFIDSRRRQFFKLPTEIVTEQSRRSALKRRQIAVRFSREAAQRRFESAEGVGVSDFAPQELERLGGEKRVTTQPRI